MAKVSLSRLKRLARLYSKEVPGSRELLDALLDDNHADVCELLELPLCRLTADVVVRRVEELTNGNHRDRKVRIAGSFMLPDL